ncbi:MAG: HIT family protein [Nanoarchaeota archaeon]
MVDCVFCKIAEKEIPSEKIYENKSFFSIYDHKPEVEGHALIISKKHFETVLNLPDTLGKQLIDAIKHTTLVLIKKYSLKGFDVISNNMKVGGQAVPHVHFHIIPRREGDSFRAWNLKERIKGFNKSMILSEDK